MIANFVLSAFAVLGLVTIWAIVVFTEAARRIPVHYSKSVFRGRRMYRQSGSTHIPLKVNSAGMIPLIFAGSLLIFPAVIGGLLTGLSGAPAAVIRAGEILTEHFNYGGSMYWLFYFLLVVGFTFFYTDVVFRQQNLSDTLQRNRGFIPGIRPGQRTADYLNGVMRRITLVGALFLGLVALLPFLAQLLTRLPANQSLIIQSTGLLIVVGVVLDTIKQLEAQLLMRHYEGFIR